MRLGLLQKWLQDNEVQRFMGINRHQGVLWFNKETFEELLWWLYAAAAVDILAGKVAPEDEQQKTAKSTKPAPLSVAERLTICYGVIDELFQAEDESMYQVEKLIAAAKRQIAAA